MLTVALLPMLVEVSAATIDLVKLILVRSPSIIVDPDEVHALISKIVVNNNYFFFFI